MPDRFTNDARELGAPLSQQRAVMEAWPKSLIQATLGRIQPCSLHHFQARPQDAAVFSKAAARATPVEIPEKHRDVPADLAWLRVPPPQSEFRVVRAAPECTPEPVAKAMTPKMRIQYLENVERAEKRRRPQQADSANEERPQKQSAAAG